MTYGGWRRALNTRTMGDTDEEAGAGIVEEVETPRLNGNRQTCAEGNLALD